MAPTPGDFLLQLLSGQHHKHVQGEGDVVLCEAVGEGRKRLFLQHRQLLATACCVVGFGSAFPPPIYSEIHMAEELWTKRASLAPALRCEWFCAALCMASAQAQNHSTASGGTKPLGRVTLRFFEAGCAVSGSASAAPSASASSAATASGASCSSSSSSCCLLPAQLLAAGTDPTEGLMKKHLPGPVFHEAKPLCAHRKALTPPSLEQPRSVTPSNSSNCLFFRIFC